MQTGATISITTCYVFLPHDAMLARYTYAVVM